MGVRKVVLVGGAMVAGVTLAQAANLWLSYQSPPDPAGPQFGLETYKAKTSELSHQGRVLVDGVAEKYKAKKMELAEQGRNLVDGMSETYKAKSIFFREGVRAMWQSVSRPEDHAQRDDFMIALQRAVARLKGSERKVDSAESNEGPAKQAKARRILFIGDSLVQGVGCEDGNGPTLPRKVAEFLADKWKVDVSWRALGISGGDVRQLREEVLPLLQEDVTVVKSQRTRLLSEDSDKELLSRPPVDAVFLVVGLNDWKKAVRTGRSWRSFREDLHELVRDIKEICGEDCTVVLPSLPGVDFAPLFREPLRSLLRVMNGRWDEQKRYLAENLKQVHFVDKPTLKFWGTTSAEVSDEMFCNDRVHPNEKGYTKWGEYLAESLSNAFRPESKKSDIVDA
ncbi:hypothetical protein NDN08_005825 [Rhodosorus marinus]|uniref:SGNH hydrolase-type esterase domain-containing protein n=1 Tax=Rhodosorus marinus TaxID=101924 RepID=A0AAV8V5J4_9RHOD|nr:hypothetical protein NDN08_005825 [Rhodosorus marinus]